MYWVFFGAGQIWLDKVIIVDLAGAALIGGALNADRQAFGQFMVGRPLVIGFLLGLFWKEPALGLWLGLWAELWWSGQPPLGGQTAPNGTLGVAAVISGLAGASALGWLGPAEVARQAGEQELALAAVGGSLLIPAAYLAAGLERRHRCWADRMVQFIADRDQAGIGPPCRLGWQLLAVGWVVVSGIVFVFVMSWVVAVLGAGLFKLLPDAAIAGLSLAPPLLSLLGMAALVNTAPRFSVLPFYCAGLLASLLTITSLMQ